jgi:hypothetical protein
LGINATIKQGGKPMTDKSEALKAFQSITDTFTGADGGVSFVNLKVLVEKLDKQHREDDYVDAGKILLMIIRFNSIIQAANKK